MKFQHAEEERIYLKLYGNSIRMKVLELCSNADDKAEINLNYFPRIGSAGTIARFDSELMKVASTAIMPIFEQRQAQWIELLTNLVGEKRVNEILDEIKREIK